MIPFLPRTMVTMYESLSSLSRAPAVMRRPESLRMNLPCLVISYQVFSYSALSFVFV